MMAMSTKNRLKSTDRVARKVARTFLDCGLNLIKTP